MIHQLPIHCGRRSLGGDASSDPDNLPCYLPALRTVDLLLRHARFQGDLTAREACYHSNQPVVRSVNELKRLVALSLAAKCKLAPGGGRWR